MKISRHTQFARFLACGFAALGCMAIANPVVVAQDDNPRPKDAGKYDLWDMRKRHQFLSSRRRP